MQTPDMAPPQVRTSYSRIAELDGVRAIAIWMVMLMHVLVEYSHPKMHAVVGVIVGHGWLGVDLFFVLSGFLITGILLDSKSKPGYFKTFYARRFFRIMPLYFVMVAIWTIFYRGYGSYFLLSSVFMANLAPTFHIRMPTGPSTLWSLAIEEQFYLMWPLLVLLLNRRKLAVLAASIVVVEPVIRAIHAMHGLHPELIYNLTWCRCDGLATGALIALWVRSGSFSRTASRKAAGALLGALIVITVAGYPFGMMNKFTVAATSLRYTQAYLFYAACFVLILAYQGTFWTAALRWKFMQVSGALSYCLYLVHGSVGKVFQNFIGYQMSISMRTTVIRCIVMISVSFLIAAISKRFLEDPCLRLKERLFPVHHPKPVPLDFQRTVHASEGTAARTA